MRFLDRNQYCVWFSHRCNYTCSYCCNRLGPQEYSEVERNPRAVVGLFNSVEPGVIMVSGGEPTLWADMPYLLDALPQHCWVILSNLSTVPDWLRHPNVKMVIAACHYEQCDLDRFAEHCEALPRVMAKVLVDPRDEALAVELWYRLTERGVLTHLAPLNWPVGCSRWLLELVQGEMLTSCLYNSRFFATGKKLPRTCVAGSSGMFQVMPTGKIVPCSQGDATHRNSTIHAPKFFGIKGLCDVSCYCEWHHWAGMTLAEDNETWNHFVETGEWTRPSPEQFTQFVGDMWT